MIPTVDTEPRQGAMTRLTARLRTDGPAFRRAFYAVADQGIVSVAGFVTGIAAGRALLPADFGLYTLGFSLVLVFVNIQNALIAMPYTVHSPKLDAGDRAQLAGSTMAHQLLVSLVSALLLGALAVLAGLGLGPKGLAPVAWALAASVVFLLLREFVRRLCFADLKSGQALALDILVAAVQIPLILWLAVSGRLTVPLAYLVMGLACGVPALGWLLASKRRFSISRRRIAPDFQQGWRLGKWLLAGSVAGTLSTQLYPWLLAAVQDSTTAGVFGACIGPLLFSNPFLLGATNLFGPDTAHAYAEGGVAALQRTVLRATYAVGAVMTLFCVVMAVAGGDIVILLYGQNYAGNGTTVALLALGLFVSSLTLPAQYGLLSLNRPDAGFVSYVLALAVALPLGVWLASAHGVIGAAIAYLVAGIVGSLYRYAVYAREIQKAHA
jgi:O-antigen/teichoic acid export membrane protein